MKYTQDEINNKLWAAADSSRTTVDGGVFKDYILTFLFYKYISDLHKKEKAKWQERYGADKERIALKMNNARFRIPEGASFYDIYAQQNKDNIGEIINKALHAIEEANPNSLENLFLADFNSQALGDTMQKNKMLRHLIHFTSRDAMDIEGLGPAVLEQLSEKGLIKDITDLYTLKVEEVASLYKNGQKSGENLVAALEKSKENPLSRLWHTYPASCTFHSR